MADIEREVRDDENGVRAIVVRRESCDRVSERRVCVTPPGRDRVQVARLRTKTRQKSEEARRVNLTSRIRLHTTGYDLGSHVNCSRNLLLHESAL
jgi:hypothetical protein